MKQYEVGITLYFHADSEEHAIEQFMNYVLSGDATANPASDVESAINVLEEVKHETEHHQ